jgi:hypothetical protein
MAEISPYIIEEEYVESLVRGRLSPGMADFFLHSTITQGGDDIKLMTSALTTVNTAAN